MKPWSLRLFTCLTFLLLFTTPGVYAQEVIEQISFEGFKKTRISFVQRFLRSEAGGVYDVEVVAGDEQSIRNLQLFSSVSSRVEQRDDKTTLVFEVEELITRLPITNFGGITDNFWLQLGINDYNWLGRGGYFGGYYQYYDRHSFKVFSLMPYLFGDRLGLSYIVGRQATLEPAYFSDTSLDFDVDRWELTSMIRYEIYRDLATQNLWTLDAGGGYLNEIYTLPGTANIDFPARTQFDKFFLKTSVAHSKINYFYHHVDGHSQQSTLEFVQTINDDIAFWKWFNEFRFFWHIGANANPAMRIVAGISSNDDTPFVPFVLDSYLNVRGSGNRVARGTSELTINLEHRQTLQERRAWAIEGVVFIDLSAWRPGNAPLQDMFKSRNVVSFTGAGARLHLRRIYNFSLRLDYGISTSDRSSRGFVLGVGQYF